MVFYFVQKGETLYHIAQRYQTTVHAIVAANRLTDPNEITPGQALKIPRPSEVPVPPPGGIVHLVRPGETVFHLARRFGTTVPDIVRQNQLAHPEFILPGQQLVIPETTGPGEEWPMVGRTSARTAASSVNLTGHPQPGWSFRPAKDRGYRPSPPVIRYDRVYAGLGDGAYHALDLAGGRVIWSIPVGGEGSGTALPAPAVFDGLIYLGAPDGRMVAVEARQGTPVWETRVGDGLPTAAAIQGGLAYVATAGGSVTALELKTGTRVWHRPLDAGVVSPPAAGDGMLFVRDTEDRIWALDGENGETVWQARDAGAGEGPVFAELLVLVGGQAYDPCTGERVWAVDEQTAPAMWGEELIYPGGAVDLFSGEYRWRRQREGEDDPPPVAAPEACQSLPAAVPSLAVAGPLVLECTATGRLVAWAAAGGREAWRLECDVPVASPPALAPGLLALVLADGRLVVCRMGSAGRSRRR